MDQYPNLIISNSLDNITKDQEYFSLHGNNDSMNLFNAVRDLYVLANSKSLLINRIECSWSKTFSGYSYLALNLNYNKNILERLISK